jgi:phosphoglycolate phosphatase-like HAD superfamily hydrolase
MRIITDFDGPIMDLTDRYYHVYQLCLEKVKLPNQSIDILDRATFWERKRAQIPEVRIGIESGLTPTQAETFKQLRNIHAHQLQYLDLDRVVPGAISALERIQSAGIELLVMTLRRTRELNAAFDRYDLGRFFLPQYRYCLPDDHQKQGDIQDKTNLMAQAIDTLGTKSNTWVIGDTEADIIAAQSQHIPVIGVLSGIRNLDRLQQYQPDKIVPDLATAIQLIIDRQN